MLNRTEKMHHGRRISEQELKEISLEGLLSLKAIFEKYNLRYYLAFGTLLGAVRHKGFIPWDDDIDILMPRVDYEKLRNLAPEIKSNSWELLSYSHEPKFLFPWMKYCNRKTSILPPRVNSGLVYGVSLDIFPLDFFQGESEEDVKHFVFGMKHDLITLEKTSYKSGSWNVLKRIVKKGLFLLRQHKVKELLEKYKELDSILLEGSLNGGEYAAYMHGKAIWKRSDFMGAGNQHSELEFEGVSFMAPFNYDAVLKKSYGDYMTPPPPEQRRSPHKFIARFRQGT